MTGACSTTPTRAEGHWSSATTAPTSASTTASTASPASPASTATTATALHWLPAPTLTAWGTGLQAKEGGAEERAPVPSHQATGQRLKGLRPTPTAPRAPPNSAMQNLRSAPCTTAFRRRIGRSQPHRAATDPGQQRAQRAQRPFQRHDAPASGTQLTICAHSGYEAADRV